MPGPSWTEGERADKRKTKEWFDDLGKCRLSGPSSTMASYLPPNAPRSRTAYAICSRSSSSKAWRSATRRSSQVGSASESDSRAPWMQGGQIALSDLNYLMGIGNNASSGDALVRRELCAEAIRLGRVLCELLPSEREARSFALRIPGTDLPQGQGPAQRRSAPQGGPVSLPHPREGNPDARSRTEGQERIGDRR